MVVVRGPFIALQYGLESTWGTAVARDTAIGRVQSANVSVNNNPIIVRGAGQGRIPDATLKGPLDVSFTWDMLLHDPQILTLAIGPRTGSGTAGSKYVATEATTVSSTQLPPFTLEKGSNDTTDETMVIEGCVINTATLRWSSQKPLTLNVSGVAETTTDSTSSTAYTEPTTLPWMEYQCTVKWGGTPSTIGRVTSGSVTINNNLITNRVIGSRFIQSPELGVLDYTFDISVLMSETSYRTLKTSFYGGASTPDTGVTDAEMPTTDEFQLVFSEGSSSGDRNFTIQLDEAILDSVSEPVAAGNNLVVVSFSGHAHKGKSNQPITWWTA